MFSKFLYNFFLFLYVGGVRVAAAWNTKARKWLAGRRNIFAELNKQLRTNNYPTVWMHCASLGEFEQGRPLLEDLRATHPGQKIVLTFFSPSGFEVMKGFEGADHVFYLPMDSADNAKKFLDAVDPSLVLWVKYEFWFYYLTEVKKRNIPTILVSGIFRRQQPFFRWYGGIWRKMLASFTHIFVQNKESKNLLAGLGFTNNITVNGDTRFDRVTEVAENFVEVPYIASFCGSSQVVVAGSTWEEDEIELLHFVHVNPAIKFIIAPHEVDKTNLKDVRDEFPNSIFYSELVSVHSGKKNAGGPDSEHQTTQEAQPVTPNVLIIDNIGMLSRLYKYAAVTYVGGGFGAEGVHNVLEAAVYGKPVIFGPVYEKFDEAVGLIKAQGGISIDGPVSLELALNTLLKDDEKRMNMGKAASRYVDENTGASGKIIRFIHEKRLLTS